MHHGPVLKQEMRLTSGSYPVLSMPPFANSKSSKHQMRQRSVSSDIDQKMSRKKEKNINLMFLFENNVERPIVGKATWTASGQKPGMAAKSSSSAFGGGLQW